MAIEAERRRIYQEVDRKLDRLIEILEDEPFRRDIAVEIQMDIRRLRRHEHDE